MPKKTRKKNMVWTPEKIAKLKKLWTQHSASEVAEKLGNISRNAVIGKANRLGLAKPHALYNKGKKRKTTTTAKTAKKTKPKKIVASISRTRFVKKSPTIKRNTISNNAIIGNLALKIEPREINRTMPKKRIVPKTVKNKKGVVLPLSMKLSLHELGEDNCKWPEGDPSQLDSLTFCGHPPKQDMPYCEYHCNKAYLNGGK